MKFFIPYDDVDKPRFLFVQRDTGLNILLCGTKLMNVKLK